MTLFNDEDHAEFVRRGTPLHWSVVDYVREEVRRQGFASSGPAPLQGIERVGWMLDAWSAAIRMSDRSPTMESVKCLGSMVERDKNKDGFRRGGVRVGTTVVNVPPNDIHPRLDRLLSIWDIVSPLDFYREFELIHPFIDGNGRTGKILLNWKADALCTPWFPPSDFWGERIENP